MSRTFTHSRIELVASMEIAKENMPDLREWCSMEGVSAPATMGIVRGCDRLRRSRYEQLYSPREVCDSEGAG